MAKTAKEGIYMWEKNKTKIFTTIAIALFSLVGCKTLFNSGSNVSNNNKEKNKKRGYYYEDYLEKLRNEKSKEKNKIVNKANKNSNNSGNNKESFKSIYEKQTKKQHLVSSNKIKKKVKKELQPIIISMKAGAGLLDEDGYFVPKENPAYKPLKKKYLEQKSNPIIWAKVQKKEKKNVQVQFKRLILEGKEYVVWAKTGVIKKKYINKHQIKYYSSFQFKLKKGKRLRSFQTLNGPGKDYHLVKSPFVGKKHYYYITDRVKPMINTSKNSLAKNLQSIKADVDASEYSKIKNSFASANKMKGTGYLEIVVCDSTMNKAGDKEIFYNPRFINLKDVQKGNKLGYALFYNKQSKLLEIYYSVNGDLHLATSTDGVTFKEKKVLDRFNTEFVERDPAISPDGKVLVFASSRNYKSNILGTQLFVARRDSVYEDFDYPEVVPQASNSLNELFPSVIANALGTFILYKTYERGRSGYHEAMYSVQVVNNGLLPPVPFAQGSAIPQKYLTASAIDKNLTMVWSSYPQNGYDLYQMKISLEKSVIVNEEGEIQIDIPAN